MCSRLEVLINIAHHPNSTRESDQRHISSLNNLSNWRQPDSPPDMQRGSYAPPPAHSPPLHHPVPQHVSTVPMMRSPPPPQSQGGSNYGSPYGQMGGHTQQPGGGGQFAPAFGGFMNDQTAQMGFQVGQKAVMAGQEYMEQSVCRKLRRFRVSLLIRSCR